MEQSLSSTHPYLLRALHEWMTDNGETPLVVVDATHPEAQVPTEHVKDGRITLNIAWSATRNLEMTNEYVLFDARFGGVAHAVSFPVTALLGIYARESGQGMQFQTESVTENVPATEAAADTIQAVDNLPDDVSKDAPNDPPKPRPNGPGLRLVK
jgi:stringent starvation protein B